MSSNWEERALDKLYNRDALYLNFNYSEFLETLYGVPKNNDLYIHSDRRGQNKKLISAILIWLCTARSLCL
ncbi:AbiH family protein [Paenibacillus sp. TAF43_2]|uniref:AbiH family protein n=1 Tax=Paenibacillus sp. TAF43_2 TaxID=3233069 RepID=UPI003F9DA07F